jgi:hypothetical protein
MKDCLEPLRQLGRETLAQPESVDRVRIRVAANFGQDASIRDLLATLPEPRPGAAQRVRTRLRHHRAWPVSWPWLVAGGFAAAAAVTVVAMHATAPAPTLVPAHLESTATYAAVRPAPGVSVDFRGSGELAGTASAPRINWEAGTVSVSVEPDQGIALSVRTREADVRVIGTAFAVTRDAMGTRVQVEHGRVAVECSTSEGLVLSAGESQSCLPASAAGLLARARTLQDQGRNEAVLDAVERGLSSQDLSPAIRGELLVVRVHALAELGDPAQALATARGYLREGGEPRTEEMRHLAAGLALGVEGCDGATPLWSELAAAGQATGAELVHLGDCLAGADPHGARLAFEAALGVAESEAQTALVRGRLDDLVRP